MKIALTTDSFVEGHGGVSTSVGALARSLRQRGHQVTVYTSADPSQRRSDLAIVGLRALRYKRFPGGRVPLAPISLIKEMANFNPDVIHNHSMGTMGIQALAAARLLGTPILGTCHVFLAGFLQYAPIFLQGMPFAKDIAWRYTAIFFNRFPQVTTPSASMRRELVFHGLRAPVAAISNGVDIDLFSPQGYQMLDSSQVTLLHVGRLGYEKRVDTILRAFAHLASDHRNVSLRIVGDGPESDALRSLSTDLGVAARVRFTGFVPHSRLSEIYRQASLFVTASTIETQGLVVLEAMSSGLPIVGVDALALPDLIQQGANGYLVAPEDELALADAMVRLLRSDELRDAMGRESRRLALEHSLFAVARNYEALYEQVGSQGPSRLLIRIPAKLDPLEAWAALHRRSDTEKCL